MTIYWPEGLPFPIQYGAELVLGSEGNKVVTDFDYGPKKRRLRFTNAPTEQSVTLGFTGDQFDQFVAFYNYKLYQGIKSFIAPILVGSKIRNGRVTISSATIPASADTYNRWSVPITFEVASLGNTGGGEDEGDINFLPGIWGYDLAIEFMDILDYEVNTHMRIAQAGVR